MAVEKNTKVPEGITLVVDENVSPVWGIPSRVQAKEIKAYCSGKCGKDTTIFVGGGDMGPLFICETGECEFLDGQMIESCGLMPNGNPVFLRKLVEFVEESNDSADSLAYALSEVHHKELHEKFKDGDWAFGIGKHKGCSEVFIGSKGEFQPFFWLDDYNPDNYRIATKEEIDHVKSQEWYDESDDIAADVFNCIRIGEFKNKPKIISQSGSGPLVFDPGSNDRSATRILMPADIAALKNADEKRKMKNMKRLATRIDN